MNKTSGTFEVRITPQSADEGDNSGVGRLLLDKTFHGGLNATSQGQMLAISGGVDGSAGYVAMERVTGDLEGKSGTFALQHHGRMSRGTPELSVSVVPDSGTGELEGIKGTLQIIIAGGSHSYEFEYALNND